MMPQQQQEQQAQTFTFPAPVGGTDGSQALTNMDPNNCLYAFNLVPSGNGITVRNGTTEFANGLSAVSGVLTMVPFTAGAQDHSDDRLFCTDRNGIYDVTAGGVIDGTSPTVGFGIQDTTSGWASYCQFETAAGVFLFLADSANGLYLYTQSTDTWSVSTITGPTVADVVFVMEWKERLWFIEKNSGCAWYLPVGAIAGAAVCFEFGNRFEHGGYIQGMYNWTVDGGDGSDDYLSVISSSGDMLVYRGTDPAQVFESQGSWFIGHLPTGRNVAVKYGGDLLLLSRYGLISMAALLKGLDISNAELYVTYKVSAALKPYLDLYHNENGWSIFTATSQNVLVITTPKQVGYDYLQFVMNLSTGAWSAWRGVPLQAGCVSYDGDVYIGDDTGVIWSLTNHLDGTLLDGTVGSAIESSLLTAFSNLDGNPATLKIMGLVRPLFQSQSVPVYNLSILVDFNVDEPTGFPSQILLAAAIWDNAVWDDSEWSGASIPLQPTQAASGLGTYVAVALNMTSSAETTLVGINTTYMSGGFM